MTEDRIHLAEQFLQESVFRSRARQAAGVALGDPVSATASGGAGKEHDSTSLAGNAPCGLGAETIVELDLSERGEELFRTLWTREVAPTELCRLQAVMKRWVERQDALDRKRNHFLRDFRQTHGFDRTVYSEEESQSFDEGLERVNTDVNQYLRQAAEELLDE